MGKRLKWKFLSCLLLCLGAGLLLGLPAGAQVTVEFVGEDSATGGDWRGVYGDCYYLLPDPQCTGFPEPLVGTPNGAVCEEEVSKIGDVNYKLIRGDNEPLRSFWLTEVLCDNSDCGDRQLCGSDFSPCDGGAQWNPCVGALKATTWDDGDNITPGGIFPPAVVELEISFAGSTDIAFYTLNSCNKCRTQNYTLSVEGAPPLTGTFNNLGEGNYLVFRITGLDGNPTTIRFETERAGSDVCPPGTTPNGTNNAHVSGVFLSNCEPEPPDCSIGDYVWEDANRDGCQDPDEDPIEGVEVKLFENCGDPTEIASTTTNAEGFYEFTGLDCGKEYRVQFGPAGDIYDYTIADQECVDGDPDASDKEDSDCSQNDGFSGCVTFPDPVNAPDNPTIDCGYVCEGKIGDFVWLDENEDGCQDEVNTGIAGVDITLSEDCVDRENPKTVQTDPDGFYMFEGLCPGEYFVEFGNGRPNTNPGQVCDGDPDVSDEKDSNCGDEALQCVELTKNNPEDPTIDCGKVGPCLELQKLVSGDGGVTFFEADNCSDADVPFTVDDAEYKLIVTNCGREAVTLDKIVDLDLGINLVLDPTVTIQPGGSVEFTNDAGQTQGLLQKEGACPNPDNQFENTATVSGTGDGSNLPVEATDPACVKCGPCVDIEKLASVDGGQTFVDADECADAPGTLEDAEYKLIVTNCGGVPLTDVTVKDPVLGIDVNIGTLDPGDDQMYTKTNPGFGNLDQPGICPADDPEIENVATVTTVIPDGNPGPTDSDPACVKCECVDIEKLVSVDGGQTFVDADECEVAPTTNSDAEYQLIVTNCGAARLTDVTIKDPVLGIDVNIGTLDPGDDQMFTKTSPGFENLGQPGICPADDPEIENVATVTTFEGPTDFDPACVKCRGGGEGCTPGYWKGSQHFDSWTAPLTPDTLFSDVFEDAFPGMTLLDVLEQGGGKLKALGRHTVAALLNAASPGVSYDLSVNDVIGGFNDVYPGDDYETLKDIFQGFNKQGCPLD